MDDTSCDRLFSIAFKSSFTGNWHTRTISEDDDDDYDDDDENEKDANEYSKLVMLGNGKWHVCKGMDCPHVEQSSETDHHYICKISGRVVSGCKESSHDASWTGRSCTSSDPDMQSGAVGGISAWKGKRNAFSASAAAYAIASNMTIDDISFGVHGLGSEKFEVADGTCCADVVLMNNQEQHHTHPKQQQDVKRGAPCIVDVDEKAIQSQKRNKAIRRISSLQDKEFQTRLISDAGNVVVKLFSLNTNCSSLQKKDRSVSSSSVTLNDPRLENYDFVLNMALKRYAARCKNSKNAPTVSGIHDVCAAANQFVKQRRREAQERTNTSTSSRKIALNGITVDLCAQLILTLWSAMCTTPHFVSHQTGDSFRPFAAGVMYALKRGLRLPNNMVLVPAIDEIASQLPTLRSSTATNSAKQLQQASHRGLCSIQRGLASIDTMSHEEQEVVIKQLKVVVSVSNRLVRFVRENSKSL